LELEKEISQYGLGKNVILLNLFVCLFLCLLACLFACLFVCLFVCLASLNVIMLGSDWKKMHVRLVDKRTYEIEDEDLLFSIEFQTNKGNEETIDETSAIGQSLYTTQSTTTTNEEDEKEEEEEEEEEMRGCGKRRKARASSSEAEEALEEENAKLRHVLGKLEEYYRSHQQSEREKTRCVFVCSFRLFVCCLLFVCFLLDDFKN
jgi:hypothetical protein